MAPTGRLEVGAVVKAHGLRGEVSVHPITNVEGRFVRGAILYDGDDALEVEWARRHQSRWLVKFLGVDGRDAALQLRGTSLTADPPVGAPSDGFWVHELIGASVVDTRGEVVGRVEAVQQNPAHDLLVLESGALIPMVFVREHTPKRVVVDPPDGLLDL